MPDRRRSVKREIQIRRLKIGDEALPINTVELQKSTEGKNGNLASEAHMRSLLVAGGNYFIGAYDKDVTIGFLIAHRFPRIDRDKHQIYLYEIGIDKKLRRQETARTISSKRMTTCVWAGCSPTTSCQHSARASMT